MSFGTIWRGTWRDYRVNFRTNVTIMLMYYIIPLVVALGIILALVLSSGFIEQWNGVAALAGVNASALDAEQRQAIQDAATGFLGTFALILIASLIVLTIFFFVSFLAYVAVLGNALKPGLSSKAAMIAGKKHYWRLLGFFCLFSLLVGGACLGAFISAMIVSIVGSFIGLTIGTTLFFISMALAGSGIVLLLLVGRWMLAPYCIAAQDADAFTAFGASWRLTRSRSWQMFGYTLFATAGIFVICIFVVLLGALASSTLGIDIEASNFLDADVTPTDEIPLITPAFFVFEIAFHIVWQTAFAFLIVPWIVSFFKQLYFFYTHQVVKRHV